MLIALILRASESERFKGAYEYNVYL